MKQLLVSLSLILLLGCTFVDKAKENIVNEAKAYELSVFNENTGIIYRENGKYYFKEDLYAEPEEIKLEDLAKYVAKTVMK